MSILNGPIWSRCSIAPAYLAKSHFQHTLNRERWVQGWDERYRSSTEGEELRDRKEKRENKRLISKKLCATLLRLFRGQHGEKMKGSARGNWDPREGQPPFRPNPNGVGDRTTKLMRLLTGADFW